VYSQVSIGCIKIREQASLRLPVTAAASLHRAMLWLVVLFLVCAVSKPAFAQTPAFTVTTLSDDSSGSAGNCNQTQSGATPDSNCSLRDALAAAGAANGTGTPTVNFASSLASASHPGTYTLSSGGVMVIDSSVNIVGPGPAALTISGGSQNQVFVFVEGTISISGLTITKGNAGNGGAIQNFATATIDNCVISGNSASDSGGGIENQGSAMTVRNSIIASNTSQKSGGIDNYGTTLTLDNTTVVDNTAYDGGGIESGSESSLTVTNSVFSGNSATLDDGGAINNYGGSLSISGSIFLSNSAAGRGGGILTLGGPTVIDSTVISGNQAPVNQGSGINNVGGTMTLTNDVIPDSIQGGYSGTVSAGPVPAMAFSLQGTAMSIAAGATSGNTSTITVTPSGGFTGSVALTASITSSPSGASDLPALSFGSSSPVSLTGTNPGTATMIIATSSSTQGFVTYPKRTGSSLYVAGSASLTCLLLCGLPRKRRSCRTLFGLFLLLFTFSFGAVACGGNSTGGGSGGGRSQGGQGTTSGSYVVLVTGKSGSTTVTTTVNLTVL
jgi:hypothetical protein